MTVTDRRARAGWNPNVKKTKVMTTEGIHDVNTDNKAIKIVKDFAYVGSMETAAKKSRED